MTQKNEGMTAHKVIIEDSFEKKGMDIGMIRVKYNGEDITNQCEISRDDTSRKFKIATGRDLSDKDELLVIYDTAFLSMIDGDIKNTAFAYSEDADKVRDDIVVTMEVMNENHFADVSRVQCLLRKMMSKEYHGLIDQIKGRISCGSPCYGGTHRTLFLSAGYRQK